MKLLLATIAISIAVGDTIQLVIRFRKAFLATGNYPAALQQSMRDVGPADPDVNLSLKVLSVPCKLPMRCYP